ncbi:MAG: DUF2235 domain-containing protein [Acidobacteria bacterium]|nr:MAG: DUF2235 domain-containing protein [Acidobacteriota bacterium]
MNVVVCCDGTWNTAEERTDGLPSPTNVTKIYNALAKTDAQGIEQKAYYHPGVGTDGGVLQHLLGGALGDGLEKNVKSAYKWLAQNFRPGDNIFIFGFSRGAYTARFVAGMVCKYGLADFSSADLSDDVMWSRVDQIYKADQARAKPTEVADISFFNVSPGQSPSGTTPIHFLGVWDTVGALGIPSDMALLKLLDNIRPHQFQNTELSKSVLHARHAVAMDEQRESFTPTLWTNVEEHPDVKQVWFIGTHGDVGGGYVQSGLSDIVLKWMMDEATGQGLAFRAGIENQLAPDPRAILHDSCTGVFAALRTLPRSVPCIENVGAATPFHASVLDRFANPPIEQSPYWATTVLRPGDETSVDIFARPHWNATGIYLEKGAEYSLEATGQWIDGDVKCDTSGPLEGQINIGEWAQGAGSLLGKGEELYKKLTGNQQADFWLTKRIEEYPWFALVGVVANGFGTDKNGDPIPHETFLIGRGAPSFRPQKSGYLYCFANDAWQMYGNNRGSVRLTVRRR